MKKFRDPIYGYIEIDKSIVRDIIDTATFQRLRNVRQTSYAPLFPASLHNRFVHSLGVYYLGKMAFEALYQSVCYHQKNSHPILSALHDLFTEQEWAHYRKLFELACLLHDVGHSPFSHTGEEFYGNSKSKTAINIDNFGLDGKSAEEIKGQKEYTYFKHLAQLTGDEAFLTAAAAEAAPHEIMSCIVGLTEFDRYFNDDHDKSFFSRCITGMVYSKAYQLSVKNYQKMTVEQHTSTQKLALLNCFIRLLNSTVIDVDRLDYIIRDATTMGYQSVSIDYERLINGIVIILEDEYNFTTGFHKNAISIIENAVYAHDNERKWIQGHPTILYENFLIQQAVIDIEKRIFGSDPCAKSTLFSFDSLTRDGSTFNTSKVCYLGDEDILHLMKNVYPSQYSVEYFNRNSRRLPVWKSEAEFKSLFSSDDRNIIYAAMESIMSEDKAKLGVEVTEPLLLEVDQEIKEANEQKLQIKADLTLRKKQYLKALLKVCEDHSILRDVVLLSTNFFKSNFSKDDVQKILILFPNSDGKICRLQDVSTTLSSSLPPAEKFVYLYCYPNEKGEKVNPKRFADALVLEFSKCNT